MSTASTTVTGTASSDIIKTSSGDDIIMMYTGGTTGMPKGVLWRNGDANIECFGGSSADTLDGVVSRAAE